MQGLRSIRVVDLQQSISTKNCAHVSYKHMDKNFDFSIALKTHLRVFCWGMGGMVISILVDYTTLPLSPTLLLLLKYR